jgi:hypothetical protein
MASKELEKDLEREYWRATANTYLQHGCPVRVKRSRRAGRLNLRGTRCGFPRHRTQLSSRWMYEAL